MLRTKKNSFPDVTSNADSVRMRFTPTKLIVIGDKYKRITNIQNIKSVNIDSTNVSLFLRSQTIFRVFDITDADITNFITLRVSLSKDWISIVFEFNRLFIQISIIELIIAVMMDAVMISLN